MIRTIIAGSKNNLLHYSNIIRNTPGFLVTGVICPEPLSACGQFQMQSVANKSTEELPDISEALIVTDNSGLYFDTIVKFLKKSRHVLIMPDSSLSHFKVKKLSKIAEEAGVVIHFHHNALDFVLKSKIVNFIPRPEYLAVRCMVNKNMIIEGKYLFEMLIREISLIFELNPFNPRKLSTSSVPFCSAEPDLINVIIEFDNGSSAGLTISSYTGEESRIMEIYSNNKMICYDSGNNMLTMIDKIASGPSIIKSEELRSIIKTEDAFFNFSRNITKEMMSQNRFVTGFAAYQTAAGIINQIMPFPVEN